MPPNPNTNTAAGLLATVSFTSESSVGWQQADFSTPVLINANTVYTVSYQMNYDTFAYNSNNLSQAFNSPPLLARADGAVIAFDPAPGVRTYPSGSNGQHGNYWVEPVFTATETINGTSGNDSVTLTQDADHQHSDWSFNGITGQIATSDPNGLSINGNGGSDVITLNYGGGNPIPNILHLNGVFTVNGLTGANPLANTNLEIGQSRVYISYSSSDPLALIQGYLKNGYNNGHWNGAPTASTGVITSTVAAGNVLQTTAVGYADSADHLIANQPVNTIELKYTLYGDTTLTGSVGFNDFTRLTQHYNQTIGGTWDIGDFNYDTSVNSADFTLMTRTYNTSISTMLVPAVAVPAAATPADTITLIQDADHQHIDWSTADGSGQIAVNDSSGMVIEGDSGIDVIVLDYTNGNPLPNSWVLNGTFTIHGLQGTNPLAGTTLDLRGSTVYIDYSGSADPLSLIRGYLINGYNGGAWDGTATSATGAIRSLNAANNPYQRTAIAFADSADGVVSGQPSNTIELKYTLIGDANLDSAVDTADQAILSQNLNQTPPTGGFNWDQGDFNYDGAVDSADSALLTSDLGASLDLSFAPQVNYAVDSSPREVVEGDFNGDGIPDLAVTNFFGDDVSVLLGNGDGTFGAASTFAAQVGAMGIVAADVNCDGKVDLVVTELFNNTVSILLGNGDGTFQPQQTVDAGNAPLGLAVADVNGDGKPDLIVANHTLWGYGGGVSVLLGNGDGTFQARQQALGYQNISDVTVADLNNDGKADIVCTAETSNGVFVLEGNGDGTFQSPVYFATGSAPWSVKVADFNGDGINDLVVANRSSASLSILLGNGDGSFQPQETIPVGSSPQDVAVADLNGDGKYDLVETNQGDGTVGILKGNGDGTFQNMQTYAVGSTPLGEIVVDLNGDGRPDIVVVNLASGTISVLLNTPGL